jgi:hypothetical protein
LQRISVSPCSTFPSGGVLSSGRTQPSQYRGPGPRREQTDVWVRATVGFAKKDGAWKATHEHFSVPFYMDGSNKAAVDLSPDRLADGAQSEATTPCLLDRLIAISH